MGFICTLNGPTKKLKKVKMLNTDLVRLNKRITFLELAWIRLESLVTNSWNQQGQRDKLAQRSRRRVSPEQAMYLGILLYQRKWRRTYQEAIDRKQVHKSQTPSTTLTSYRLPHTKCRDPGTNLATVPTLTNLWKTLDFQGTNSHKTDKWNPNRFPLTFQLVAHSKNRQERPLVD